MRGRLRCISTRFDESNRYRIVYVSNISPLFGHLTNDAVSWAVLQEIKINEDNTISSSHMFVTESMGLPTLKTRFVDPEIKASCANMLPLNNP